MCPQHDSNLPFGPRANGSLGWLDDIESTSATPPDSGASEASESVAVLEARLADTERRRVDAEVRLRVLEEEHARLVAQSRERQGLERRIDRLRREVAQERARGDDAQRELSESRFRMVEQESSLGALREVDGRLEAAERDNDLLEEIAERLADRLEAVVDGSRPISRSSLRRIVEALRLSPEASLAAVRKATES